MFLLNAFGQLIDLRDTKLRHIAGGFTKVVGNRISWIQN